MFFLASGKIRLRLFDRDVADVEPGLIFGEEAVLASRVGRRLLTAVAEMYSVGRI